MKRQCVSVVGCWQLQTLGKGYSVGQQPLEYFAVKNMMGVVDAAFFIPLGFIWSNFYVSQNVFTPLFLHWSIAPDYIRIQ